MCVCISRFPAFENEIKCYLTFHSTLKIILFNTMLRNSNAPGMMLQKGVMTFIITNQNSIDLIWKEIVVICLREHASYASTCVSISTHSYVNKCQCAKSQCATIHLLFIRHSPIVHLVFSRQSFTHHAKVIRSLLNHSSVLNHNSLVVH